MSAIRVLRRVKFGSKRERLAVDLADWNYVFRAGKRIRVDQGIFVLEYRDPHKVRRSVGDTVHGAKAALASQEAVLDLRARGVQVEDAPEIHRRRAVEGKTLAAVIESFRNAPPIALREKTISAYNDALSEFAGWARRNSITHLCQVNRDELLAYMAYLLNVRHLSKTTIKCKTVAIRKIFRDAGTELTMRKGDWPRITQLQPESYTPEMLRPFFAGLDRDDFILFQTYLLTGFREQEVAHLMWEDFRPHAGTLSVSKKAGVFDPKTCAERTNEIPPILVELLLEHRQRRRPGTRYIFGRRAIGSRGGDRPDGHHLHKLKQRVLLLGLNCGLCRGTYNKQPASCATAPICEKWYLHRFRHTYATTMLHDGWDVRTVQDLMGHGRLESTMCYPRHAYEGTSAQDADSVDTDKVPSPRSVCFADAACESWVCNESFVGSKVGFLRETDLSRLI